jgi:upstream activation factor subunit UAF30
MSSRKAETTTTTSKTTKTKNVKLANETQPEPVAVVEVTKNVENTENVENVETTENVENVETLEVSLRQRFDALIKARQDQLLVLKQEIAELRKMQRDHEHALKDASKKSKKKKSRDDSTPRKPSGFASPVVVSDELYKFLEHFGVNNGDPIARMDVTRYLTTYIKEKDLQNPEHRREIIPDATLKKLFGEPMELKDPNDPNSVKVYTYLRIQKYISPHFPKKN